MQEKFYQGKQQDGNDEGTAAMDDLIQDLTEKDEKEQKACITKIV